ncbi:hypothetical protein HK096_007069, partial [Nowakowskiella sp. JEL0078]
MVPPHVFLCCSFCELPILSEGIQKKQTSGVPIENGKKKFRCCPNCLKPLPRCALCLLPLGVYTETLQSFFRPDSMFLFIFYVGVIYIYQDPCLLGLRCGLHGVKHVGMEVMFHMLWIGLKDIMNAQCQIVNAY